MKIGDNVTIFERRFGQKKKFEEGIYLGDVLTLIGYTEGLKPELIKTFKIGNCIVDEKNCEWKLLKKDKK